MIIEEFDNMVMRNVNEGFDLLESIKTAIYNKLNYEELLSMLHSNHYNTTHPLYIVLATVGISLVYNEEMKKYYDELK